MLPRRIVVEKSVVIVDVVRGWNSTTRECAVHTRIDLCCQSCASASSSSSMAGKKQMENDLRVGHAHNDARFIYHHHHHRLVVL